MTQRETGGRTRRALWRALPYAGVVLLFLAARAAVLPSGAAAGMSEWADRLRLLPPVVAFYARHLTFPFHLSVIYGAPDAVSVWVGTGVVVVAAGALTVARAWTGRTALLAVWMVLVLLPALMNILVTG